MRKNLVVGILREAHTQNERRAPLTPTDVRWLRKKAVRVEVESSQMRIFKDEQYKRAGARVLDRFDKANLLLGIKQPDAVNIYRNKIYMVFSHTIKGQPENIPLLKEFIKKRVTLIDYEKIADSYGRRLVYFGRFAGICGLLDSLHYLGRKLEYKGIGNPFDAVKPAYEYNSLNQATRAMSEVGRNIKRRGLDRRISPFIIGITGHGSVSNGIQEILRPLDPVEVHPRDMLRFVRHQKYVRNKIYKIVFLREEKLRSKNGSGFYFEEYLKHPKRFESNMDVFLPYLNMLLHASYWDNHYPRMVTKKMVNKLSRRRVFRLRFIGDISCDISGSIELTYKTTTQDNPVFTYNPKRRVYYDGYKRDGITVLAIDNLPTELPRDSSEYFGGMIRDYIYQIAAHGVRDITNHAAISKELRRAVIAQGGRLTKGYRYLKEYLR